MDPLKSRHRTPPPFAPKKQRSTKNPLLVFKKAFAIAHRIHPEKQYSRYIMVLKIDNFYKNKMI
jgi:hypothetical protein